VHLEDDVRFARDGISVRSSRTLAQGAWSKSAGYAQHVRERRVCVASRDGNVGFDKAAARAIMRERNVSPELGERRSPARSPRLARVLATKTPRASTFPR